MKSRKEAIKNNPSIEYVPHGKLVEHKAGKDGKPYLNFKTTTELLRESGQLADNRKIANATIQQKRERKRKIRMGGNNRAMKLTRPHKKRPYVFVLVEKIRKRFASKKCEYNLHSHDLVKIQDSEVSEGIFVKVKKPIKTILVWGEGEIMGFVRPRTRKVFPPVEKQ